MSSPARPHPWKLWSTSLGLMALSEASLGATEQSTERPSDTASVTLGTTHVKGEHKRDTSAKHRIR